MEFVWYWVFLVVGVVGLFGCRSLNSSISRQEIPPMKIRMNTQIPEWAVYVAVYGILFGVSAFVLIRDPEGSTNLVLYVGMIWAVAAGAVKISVPRLRRTGM
jgi:hypothetical protein